MDTRRRLVERNDVDNADIDDIIEIAARLQDDDEAAEDRASVEEVEAVAEELDIDPAYVEQAIEVLATQRREAALRAVRTRGQLQRGALVLAAIVLLVAGGWWVSNQARTARVRAAQTTLDQAETQLDAVLQRQATLAPQLVALAGGDATALTSAVTALREADTIEAKLDASETLSLRMATTLGSLPRVDEDVRLNLQHELTGTQNRISVERQRYQAAKLARDEAARSGC